MNTVEELRKAFARGHVLKGVDWIFDLARALEERVEKLEVKPDYLPALRNAQDALVSARALRNVDHETRWHATRDAVLQGLMACDDFGDLGEVRRCVDQYIRTATEFADRAHGPLEAKPVDSALRFATTEGWATIAQVEALVKAAWAIDETALSQALTGAEWKALVMDLRAALKPFEAVKP